MSVSTIKPWNQVVRLRDEVRTGQLSLQEFAADLFDVIMGTGERPLYEDPSKFFSLTYATSSLRDIVAATAERLRGQSARGIRQLELTYGGGKTHTMVTVTHLFRDPAALPNIPSVQEFRSAMGGDVPKARVAAVCFDKLDLEKGIRTRAPDGEERWLKQPWSVIAFQLAGVDGLRMIHPDGLDEERESPPRDGGPLEGLLKLPAKEGMGTLILFDEVLMYAAEKASHPTSGQHFRTQFVNFLQSLTQAVAGVDTAAMIVSLLASDPNRNDEFGRQLLNDMANVMARKEDESFLPVGRDDVAEVLRRRLLDPQSTRDPEAYRPNVVAVVKALASVDPEFAKTTAKRDERERQYLASFPFDPALMDVFYTKWTSGLPLFQRTRGVLRTFAVALRDAETWDKSPIAGASILLSKPGDENLSSALRDLAEVARVEQVDGASHNWIAIIARELTAAREAQLLQAGLDCREIEQAVVGTFLHSQPQGGNHLKGPELMALIGAGKPDRIVVEKGLQAWADRSWFLDETHLDSGERRPEGRGLPKTWRLGDQPNLTQMHDDARRNRVTTTAVDDALQAEIKVASWLDAGAQAAGAKVHRLATVPADVPDDGEFRYVVLGPAGQSESGKPSALAIRFCDEATDATRPRANKNAIVIVAPSKTGIDITKDRIRDYLAWEEVRTTLATATDDPKRMSSLSDKIKASREEFKQQLRQAYCIVVTRDKTDVVHAFKVTVDTKESLFATVKKDAKSRIQETTLAPDTLLPDGPYDLWREDEPQRRVRDLVSAFGEQSKLPKMLRRSEMLKTIANGAEQGLFVLSLKRPDGTSRTWWHSQIDETALADPNLEAVQNKAAELSSLAPAMMVPGALQGLGAAGRIEISELISYFSGSHTIDIAEEDWTISRAIPKCGESTILDAIAQAVESGLIWVISGPASIWKEKPPVGVINKMASILTKPDPIAVADILPETLPEAWTGDQATALSIQQALSRAKGLGPLPWPLVADVVTGALNNRYIEQVPGPIDWPCEPHQAGALQIQLPRATNGSGGGGGGGGGTHPPVTPPRTRKAPFREAALDSAAIQNLADVLDEITGAAGSLTVRFRVGIEFGEDEVVGQDIAKALDEALAKVSTDFKIS